MNRRSTRSCTWWLVWIVCASGCANEFVPVSGHVEWQGKPLERGMVVFHSEPNGIGPMSIGMIADGAYSVRTGNQNGIRPGAYRVTVAEFTAPISSVAGAPPVLLTPLPYSQPKTTPLRYTVPPSGGTFDIVLEDKIAPKDRPLTPNDLWATIYRHLGIDYNHAFLDHTGRPMPILPFGEPIRELI